jgi:hypothetical protein
MEQKKSIDSIAWRAHESVMSEEGLESLIRVPLHETGQRLTIVQATYDYCATRAQDHPAWHRTARSIHSAIETGLFRERHTDSRHHQEGHESEGNAEEA